MAGGARTLFVNLSEVNDKQGEAVARQKKKIRRGEESGVECEATTSLRRSEIHRGGERELPRVELRERKPRRGDTLAWFCPLRAQIFSGKIPLECYLGLATIRPCGQPVADTHPCK